MNSKKGVTHLLHDFRKELYSQSFQRFLFSQDKPNVYVHKRHGTIRIEEGFLIFNASSANSLTKMINISLEVTKMHQQPFVFLLFIQNKFLDYVYSPENQSLIDLISYGKDIGLFSDELQPQSSLLVINVALDIDRQELLLMNNYKAKFVIQKNVQLKEIKNKLSNIHTQIKAIHNDFYEWIRIYDEHFAIHETKKYDVVTIYEEPYLYRVTFNLNQINLMFYREYNQKYVMNVDTIDELKLKSKELLLYFAENEIFPSMFRNEKKKQEEKTYELT